MKKQSEPLPWRVAVEREMDRVRHYIYAARLGVKKGQSDYGLDYAGGFDDGTDIALHAISKVLCSTRPAPGGERKGKK